MQQARATHKSAQLQLLEAENINEKRQGRRGQHRIELAVSLLSSSIAMTNNPTKV